jgi:hypothetical protein
MDGNRVQNLPTPSANGDAVTKSYADGLLTGYRTASAQDEIDASLQSAVADKADSSYLCYAITGAASPPTSIQAGSYIILRNSTISGVTDGLYTAAQTIPANTAIDATYLSAVSGGGLNDLYDKLLKTESLSVTLNTTYVSLESWGSATAVRIGRSVYVRIYGFRPVQATPSGASFDILTISGVQSALNINAPILDINGGIGGRCGINGSSNTVYIASIKEDSLTTKRFISFGFPIL